VLATLLRGGNLSAAAAAGVMDDIVAGAATPERIAAFAVLLRAKGETAEELSGLVASLQRHGVAVPVDGHAVDLVGTGGDGADTVNITTMSALVVAGTGRRVVKHGGRSASSACGSADVLEELGVRLDLTAPEVAATVARVGIGFCFAPGFQPGLRHVAAVRAQLGVPTVFNQLGPLINPARPAASLVGCAEPAIAQVMAQVFADRGDTALVVRGDDGLDELSTGGPSTVWLATRGEVRRYRLDPTVLGIGRAPVGALRGGGRRVNAEAARRVLAGGTGPVRDAVLLNAAAAIAAHDGFAEPPSVAALRDALRRALAAATHSIDSGAAENTLHRWVGHETPEGSNPTLTPI
jgi:anthranilate phosphoribosyltransferase